MRATRAWAAGSNCAKCPRFPVYPRECVEPEPIVWRDDVDDDGGAECPVYLGKQFEKYFFGWRQMEKGFLPHPGGWADQPAHWIEAFEIIGAVVAEIQALRLEQMKQQHTEH